MRTQDNITQTVKEASDIVEVINQYVTLKRVGKNYKGLCPFHQEKTPSFYVNFEEQYFKCFGCGAGGDVFKFLQMYSSISFPEAKRLLADRANIRLEEAGAETNTTSRGQVIKINRWAADIFRKNYLGDGGRSARDYVVGRGIAEEIAERFSLGFAPDSYDFLLRSAGSSGISMKALLEAGLIKARAGGGYYDVFRNRLMFPILDPSGQVLGFGGRTLGDDPAKYINSPETSVFSKSRCLYGLHQNRGAFRSQGRAVVVEGYTDVMMAHQHGFYETVATLGTAMTEQHLEILRRYVPQVVLVFDADEAGMRAADRGLELAIRSELEVHLARIPEGKDPCDYLTSHGGSDFEDLLKKAPSALEFKWQFMVESHQSSQGQVSKHAVIKEFIAFLARLSSFGGLDPIQQGLMVNHLAAILGASKEAIHRLIKDAQEQAVQNLPADVPELMVAQRSREKSYKKDCSPEEAVALETLMLVLCEPGLYGRLESPLEISLFSDERVRRVAQRAWRLIERVGGFSTTELLQEFDDPADTALVLELVEEGRLLGDSSERLAHLQQRQAAMLSANRSREVGQELCGIQSDLTSYEEETRERWSELAQQARQYADHANNLTGIRRWRSKPRVVES